MVLNFLHSSKIQPVILYQTPVSNEVLSIHDDKKKIKRFCMAL